MEEYRIILRTTFAPIARPAGGFMKKAYEEEFWRDDDPPTKEEWEIKNLEAMIRTVTQEQRLEICLVREVVFQKRRLIKLGKKIFELGWKDLPPPEYV